MAADDTFSVSCDLTYNGQNCVNVLHFKQIGSDGTGVAMASLETVWDTIYKTLYRGLMVITVNVVQVRVRRLAAVESQSTITAVGLAGTHSGQGMPTHSAALLRQRGSSTDPRKGTGGQKIVGVPRSIVEAGRLTQAYADLLIAYGQLGESDETDGATGYTFRQCILDAAGNSRIIVHNAATPRLITVRSRQIGVGA